MVLAAHTIVRRGSAKMYLGAGTEETGWHTIQCSVIACVSATTNVVAVLKEVSCSFIVVVCVTYIYCSPVRRACE